MRRKAHRRPAGAALCAPANAMLGTAAPTHPRHRRRYKPDPFKTFTEAVMNLKFEVRWGVWVGRLRRAVQCVGVTICAGCGWPPRPLAPPPAHTHTHTHCLPSTPPALCPQEEPMYAAYITLFEPLLGASAPARPLQVENAVKVRRRGGRRRAGPPGPALRIARLHACTLPLHPHSRRMHTAPPLRSTPRPRAQVGQKRGRSQLEEMNADGLDGAKRKKIRLGFPASQWVTVYNKHAPMKQRCALRAGGGRLRGRRSFSRRAGARRAPRAVRLPAHPSRAPPSPPPSVQLPLQCVQPPAGRPCQQGL